MTRKEFFTELVRPLVERSLLIFDEPNEVINLLIEVNTKLYNANFIIGVEPNYLPHVPWEAIVIYVMEKKNNKIIHKVLCDRIDIKAKIREIFGAVMLGECLPRSCKG